ncbi:hypothetical protein [uncultured Sphingomonas sp.]|uniref:hypothetical protein n=1 Tax=uncultured Sphingomonas sp. TaxID=158754 RepID=UPI0026321A58|nr:hypothetical protein [uncultured Sphingomonas sp.]
MNAGTVALPHPPKPDLPRHSPEDAVDVVMQQTTTLFGYEEIGASGRSEMCVSTR